MEYEDWDNASVGSLAVPIAEGVESGSVKKVRKREEGEFDDEASDSPMARVRQQSSTVKCNKMILLFAMVAGGCYVAVSTYIYAESDPKGSLHAIICGIIFAFMIILYLRYDFLVTRRNSMVMDMAIRSRTIVDQLFPSVVRDRLLNEGSASRRGSRSDNGGDDPFPVQDFAQLTKLNTLVNQRSSADVAPSADLPQNRGPTTVKNFLATGGIADKKLVEEIKKGAQPIADLFPNTTVLFADIAGFTAWSSQRDPPQVFRLLETVYGAFDEIAPKLKVFKVETIGDSYMAVTGLPEPDENHAVSMARFAYQCLVKMEKVCENLEGVLGPGTEELAMRIGLHSGPVTAGVLRGQKSRFQLFGDTVNTASRMESTGIKGRIQVSQDTANLLIQAGKVHWIKERVDRVVAKGKGELTTFWLEPHKKGDDGGPQEVGGVLSEFGDDSDREENPESAHPDPAGPRSISIKKKKNKKDGKKDPQRDLSREIFPMSTCLQTPAVEVRLRSSAKSLSNERFKRLIDWNADVLLNYLSEIMDHRPHSSATSRSVREVDHDHENSELPPPFESVAEVIILPPFDPARRRSDGEGESAMKSLREDLRLFVTDVAAMYNTIPFHNFEHASHVMLAANKLVSRMTSSEYLSSLELYQVTYGISADPLTQFAVVFAALIHDLGHTGVSNAQLVLEAHELSEKFKNKSVAEQHAVSLAWNLLMQPRYKRLRSCIYKTNAERKRFRQVLINAVMATDIADRGVNQMRAKKWDKAFNESDDLARSGVMTRDEINRKATAVIESLMQVADVAHTMQHWNIYRKWNSRLFEEMYSAYMNGRASFDPTDIWYKGEIAFFDHFVIPLAKKINKCGVFGESGGQYLTYAVANRNNWDAIGRSELNKMIHDIHIVEPDLETSNHVAAWREEGDEGTDNNSEVDSEAPIPELPVGKSITPIELRTKDEGKSIPINIGLPSVVPKLEKRDSRNSSVQDSEHSNMANKSHVSNDEFEVEQVSL